MLTGVDARETRPSSAKAASLTSFGAKAKSIRFPLISDANLLRKGTRLRLYLGGTSTVQNIANLLYLKPVPDGSRLKVQSVALTVPALQKTISK